MRLGLGLNIKTSGGVDFKPSDLGSTLDLWYQYNTGQTNLSGTDGNSDNRMQWSDQSGNARHAQQDTDAAKPTITSGYLAFDDTSTNDFMNIVTGTGALNYGHPNPFTMVIALRRDTATEGDKFIGANSSEFLGLVGNQAKLQTRATGAVVAHEFDDDYFTTGSDYIITVTKDSSGNILVYKNSNALTYADGSPTTNTGGDMTLDLLGSNLSSDTIASFDGRVYELIVCDTVLSTSDRNSTIDYLKSKLSIS
jgi:hypothetical protein